MDFLMDTRIQKLDTDEALSSSTSTEDDTLKINTDLDTFNKALYGNLPFIFAKGEEYPIMQRINGAIYCLLCDKYISETPLTHTDKAVHIKKERGGHFTALKEFHKVCNALPVKMQVEHRLYFRRFKKSMMCIICCQTLPYEFAAVRKHINSQFHQVNHSDEILKEKDALLYTPASVKILFENLPSIDINALSYPIMQYQCGGDIFCLSCQTNIEGLPKDHMRLKSHISKSAVQEYREKLIQYHKVWSSLPGHFQQQQIYFGLNSNNLTCFLCKTEVKCNVMLLKTHLCESVHKKAHKANKGQNEMGKKAFPNNDLTGKAISQQDSSSKVGEQCDATSTSSSSFREQHIGDDLKLSNELAANNVNNITNDNKLNLASTSKMEYLSEEDLETSDRSIYSTGTIDSDLMEDINSDSDEGNLEEFDSEGEEELQPTMEENERPYCARRYEDNRMNENTYNARTNFIAHPNTSPIKVPTIFPSYHSSTSEALYGNGLIHYNILLDAVKYPLIQNIGPYKHCLVCAQSLSSELFHCNSESHINNAKSQEKQYLLRKYHTVFVQLPIKYQLQQKYFRKEDQLRCILCNVSVPYDFKLILGHVQMPEHIYKQVIFEATPSSIGNSTQQEKGASSKISSPKKSKIKHTSKIDDSRMVKMENGISNIFNNINGSTVNNQDKSTFRSLKEESPKHTKSNNPLSNYLPVPTEKMFENLEEYTITVDSKSYFIFRNSVLGIRCIICNDGPVINPGEHKKTLNHVKHTENETSLQLLKTYHDMWTTNPTLQEHLFYIVQKYCHLCHMSANDEQLRIHVLLNAQMKNSLDRAPHVFRNGMSITNTCNNSHETIAKQQVMPMFQSAKKEVVKQTISKISIDYLPATKETIFKDLEGYTITVDSENYFVFRHSVLGIRCILCNDGPVSNPDDHKKTLNHVQHMENITSLRLLKKYHDMWTNDPRLQEHQFYIVQKHCRVCHITTNDEQLKVHVSSLDHMKTILDRAPQIPGNGMIIDGQVQASVQLCPNTNQPKAPTTPKVQSITFENNTKTDLPTSDDEPAKQSGSTEITLNYTSWIKETVYCDLAQYVVTVDDVKYPYLRRSWKGIRCLLCEDNPVSFIDVHVNSEHHMKLMETPLAHIAVSDYHQFWLAEKSPYGQSQQIYFIHQQCVLCSRNPEDQPHVLEHMRSKLHTDAENCYTCEDLLNNMGIGDRFQYCKEAIDAFYKDLDNYWLYYGIIKLPLLRMTSEGIRCILCEDTGVTSVTSHVEASGHQQALHDPHKIEKLRKFHKMWQNMSPRAQMQQQYVILMMCIVCDKKLSLDTGEAHMLSKTHKGNVTLKQNAKEKSTPTKKHDIKESAINSKSQHIAHQLPYYLSYHLEVLNYVNKENKIHCKPCNQHFIKLSDLRRHLDGDAHCKLSKLKRYKGKFYCEICMMNFCNEVGWLAHLENLKHLGRITKLGDSRKANVKEHACRTCGMVIFGDAISLLRHGRNNKAEKDSKLSLNKKLTKLLSSQKYIIDTAEQLLKLSEADKVQNEDYIEECCRDLRNTVGGYFRKCDVYPFGSRVTGLGNTSSDLDVFIDIGGVYDGAALQSPLQQADIVRRIGAVLSSNTKQFSQINMVPGARTPIVKVLYMDRSIDCDISFRHGLSVENTKFIKFCLDLQPIAKPAMLFLKDWISNSDLPFGSITSYAFTLLFIFFLQRSDYLLSVVKIRKINNSRGRMIDGWEAINYTQSIEIMKTYVKKCNLPMPHLLLKFFEFYSNFDFNNLVICPLLGQTQNKFNFHPRNLHLPPEMATYTKKLNDANPEHFKCRTPMCVQDPFDLSHNVTKGCPEMVMKTFQINCRLSKSQISALK